MATATSMQCDSNVSGGLVTRALTMGRIRTDYFSMDDIGALDAAVMMHQGSMVRHEYRYMGQTRGMPLANVAVRQGESL